MPGETASFLGINSGCDSLDTKKRTDQGPPRFWQKPTKLRRRGVRPICRTLAPPGSVIRSASKEWQTDRDSLRIRKMSVRSEILREPAVATTESIDRRVLDKRSDREHLPFRLVSFHPIRQAHTHGNTRMRVSRISGIGFIPFHHSPSGSDCAPRHPVPLRMTRSTCRTQEHDESLVRP